MISTILSYDIALFDFFTQYFYLFLIMIRIKILTKNRDFKKNNINFIYSYLKRKKNKKKSTFLGSDWCQSITKCYYCFRHLTNGQFQFTSAMDWVESFSLLAIMIFKYGLKFRLKKRREVHFNGWIISGIVVNGVGLRQFGN